MVVHAGVPTSYEVHIDEEQRLEWIRALELLEKSGVVLSEYILDMLRDLPRIELESPGTTHGICL